MNYNHKEAYCLMMYQCEACGKLEEIYNSRDGVSPFMVKCAVPGCEGQMVHILWQLDRCEPDHVLQPFQRYFKDTDEESLRRYVERHRERIIKAGMDPEIFLESQIKNMEPEAPMIEVNDIDLPEELSKKVNVVAIGGPGAAGSITRRINEMPGGIHLPIYEPEPPSPADGMLAAIAQLQELKRNPVGFVDRIAKKELNVDCLNHEPDGRCSYLKRQHTTQDCIGCRRVRKH